MQNRSMQFEIIFSQLLNKLKQNNFVEELSNHYKNFKNIEDLFNKLWHLNIIQDVTITEKKTAKSNLYSELLRKQGNKYFVSKKLDKALEYYTKCIMFAEDSFNTSNVEITAKNVCSLSLGYANHSAVLFDLQLYDDCRISIEKSLLTGYPTLLKPKLVERLCKCYIALNNIEKAKKVLEDYIIEFESLDEKEKKLLDNTKNKIVELISSTSTSTEKKEIIINNEKLIPRKISDNYQDIFSKDLKYHPYIKSLNEAADLSYSDEKGRFLIAKRDILPGETVVCENGYEYTLLPDALTTHCSKCLKKVLTPVPCPLCPNVLFCSSSCQEKAKLSFHGIECPILATLNELDMGKNANLALRIVTNQSLDNLKMKILTYEKENLVERAVGFNPLGIYQSDDYRTIYNLITNQDSRSVADLFKRSIIALCLVKILQQTNYFGVTDNIQTSDIIFVGSIIFRHLMNLPCNAHSVTEFQIESQGVDGCLMKEVGAGAFAVLSLFNHSCHPSVARTSFGKTIIARAIKLIRKGEEITDSYGQHYALHSREERQRELLKQYYFSCSCHPCFDNWQLYAELPELKNINCPHCKSNVILESHNCKQKEGKIFRQKLKSQIDNFRLTYENITKGFVTYENDILELISSLCLYSDVPSKIFFEAQECLKFCFDRKGSHWICN